MHTQAIKTLHALEKAICTLDEIRQSKQVNQDMVMDALKDARSARVELLKTVGEHSLSLSEESLQERFQKDRSTYRERHETLDVKAAPAESIGAADEAGREKMQAERHTEMMKHKPAQFTPEEKEAQTAANKVMLAEAETHKTALLNSLQPPIPQNAPTIA